MVGVRFEIEGKDAALAALSAAVSRLDDPTPLYDEIGASLVFSTQNRFDSETDPDGSPWPASLRAKLDGGKTLTDTRTLFNSITHEANKDGVAVGTNVLYAAIHQFGGIIHAKTPKGLRFRSAGNGDWVNVQSVTMPQRAFLGLDKDDEKEIEALAGDYITAPLGDRDDN